MNKDLAELVFILDKSGSMCGKEEDVIGGFNSTIEKQKKNDYETLVTTVLFSDRVSTIHDRVSINEVKPLTSNDYYTDGTTALYDAVGSTIEHIKDIQKYVENKPKKTLFVIMTDGYENSSTMYSELDIHRLISTQKEKKWEFVFLGADIDATQISKNIGIEESRVTSFSKKKMGTMYDRVSKIVDCCCAPNVLYADADEMFIKGDWKKDLD